MYQLRAILYFRFSQRLGKELCNLLQEFLNEYYGMIFVTKQRRIFYRQEPYVCIFIDYQTDATGNKDEINWFCNIILNEITKIPTIKQILEDVKIVKKISKVIYEKTKS
ncbi:hypothetical protein [Mycoplasma buteonis]|uniref:hypothetical protein n=1 Tax=Mycoplasma buteonis TaxID=171280 RepID=UPI000568BB40|nr:hypothetical protein [Mycoplasma buteonis]